MFSFFRKEKWALVKSVTSNKITWGKEKDGIVSVHLFESDKGNRKIECICSFPDVPQDTIDNYVKSTEYYHKTLYRWLAGRYNPEIPRYSQIGEEDTANALRGKVE